MGDWARTYFEAIGKALKRVAERTRGRDGDLEAAIEWADDGARFAEFATENERDKKPDHWWNEIQGG